MDRIYKIMILLLLLTSCLQEDHFNLDKQGETLLTLGAEINQVAVTRVNDDGFCDGDAMGIYVVDYSGDQAGELKTSGNRANNVRYTYDEANNRWQGDYDVYYKDHKTPVDIYAYYPVGSPDNTSNYSFTVQQNQSVEGGNGELGGYEASDFLWGKATKVSPTDSRVMIKLNHIMSCVRVELVEGEGFSAGEWNNLEKNIVLKSLRRGSNIDLSTGTVSAAGEMESAGTVPYRKGDSFRAIVVPQTVPGNAELFSISVGTVPYTFSREDSMEYISGKMHKFTIKVNRKGHEGSYEFALVGESITAWENDDVSHDATMREYIVVNSTAGGLREAIIALGKDFRQLQNLKVTGGMNEEDFYFMRDSMDMLTCLNLREVDITKGNQTVDFSFVASSRVYQNVKAIPQDAFRDKSSLSRVVFPDKLDIIGPGAFCGTSITGNLTISAGIKAIGTSAFERTVYLNGALSFPASLECIGAYAFYESGVTGNLILPDNLEEIGQWAFVGCVGLRGGLKLPSKLSVIESYLFYRTGFSGDLVIPDNVKIIKECAFIGMPSRGRLTLSENLEYIGPRAFEACGFTGTLVLPESLKIIGNGAFRFNAFVGDLVLPEKLESIGKEAFQENPMLSGIVTIPDGIETLPSGIFANCGNLEGVILPESVNFIGAKAFENCFMLNKIVSKANIPPVLTRGCFTGVPKDNFVVEVPQQSVMSYVMAEGWSEFKRISAHHELVCRPAYAVAINNKTTRTLVLDAEGEWEVESIPEWCSLSQSAGDKKTELKLTINEMASGSATREGEVVFKLKGTDYTATCVVSQYDYKYREDEVITLQKATRGNNGGINLVFLGDGYDGKDISEGKYLADVQERVEQFFSIHPYSDYREYFNVYTAIAVSDESGVGTVNTIRYNKFGTSYTKSVGTSLKCNLFAVFSYLMRCNTEDVCKYVLDMNTTVTASNLHEALIVVLPNSDEFGGTTCREPGVATISICPRSTKSAPYDSRGVILYEACGQGFGKFADETVTRNKFVPDEVLDKILYYQSFGWYRNISVTGKIHETPWSHLVFDERYSDIVDVFEGGYGYSRGVYRSEANSCMNDYEPYFSTICREDIVRRIKNLAGETYSFEEFVAADSREKQ